VCITLVIYQESLHDARSTKCKISNMVFNFPLGFRISDKTSVRWIMHFIDCTCVEPDTPKMERRLLKIKCREYSDPREREGLTGEQAHIHRNVFKCKVVQNVQRQTEIKPTFFQVKHHVNTQNLFR